MLLQTDTHLGRINHIIIECFYRLLIKIINFYFPLFNYCMMTSAGGNVTFVPCGKKVKLPPDESKYFHGFVIGKLRNCK